MNTIEAKNIESETASVERDSRGNVVMRTDAHGRHLYCVRGEVNTDYGLSRPGTIFVWAHTARDARSDGPGLYEAMTGNKMRLNRVFMPIC